MKKLLMFLVLLTVSVGTWAAATATKIADSGNQTLNGKGFTYNHTAYAITTGAAGDLARELNGGATISETNNTPNKLGMDYGTYFTFSGPLNATDLAALSQFGASISNDVYFDFSNATFVDENDAPITDTSLLSHLNNAKAKYIILPNTTTSVSKSNFPSSVKEALAINGNSLYGYSSSDGGALEHVLAFDKRYATEGNTVTDYTLVGTYTYIQDPSTTGLNARGAATYSTSGLHNSVFGVIKRVGDRGYTSASIVNLDLSGATFPNYSDEAKTYQATEGLSTWTGPTNGMELIHEYASSLTSIKLPETEGTTLIPYQALYNCTHVTALEIPGNIETLGMECFYSMTGATSITFNVGLKHMAPDVFLNCSSVTSIALPVGLEEIGEYAFIKCSSLDELIIPEGVKVIKAGAFEQTAIKSVRLPHTLKSIEKNAFRQCSQLQTMTFPEDLEYIGEDAFKLCYGLTDVYFLGTTTIPVVHENAFDKECYANNGGLASGGETNTNISHTYGDYSTALIDSNTGTKKKVDLSSWVDYDANGVKVGGATVMHYPLEAKEAKYKDTPATTTELTNYKDAQTVDENQVLYFLENGNYKRVYFTPESGQTYFSIPNDAWKDVTTSQSGVTAYYNGDKFFTNPHIQCGDNGASPQYYAQDGMKPTWSSVVRTPQKDENNEWITTYYKKEWDSSANKEVYKEYPLSFSQPKYHSPVTSEVDNYVGTTQPVSGVTEYYASDGATNTVTPQLSQSLYYVTGSQTGGYVNTNREFKGGNTAYYIFNNSTSQYERVYPGFNGYTVYSDNAGNTQVSQMSSDVTTYYYIDYTDNNTIKEIPNGLQVFDYYNTYYYYDENVVTPVYSSISEYNSGTTYYYKDHAGSYIEQTSLQFNTTYYYKDGTKTVTTYQEATEWDPNVETYYTKNGDNYTAITSWSDGDFSGEYYYQTGEEPNIVSVCGNLYDANTTYYTNNAGTIVADFVNFDGIYYTLDVTKVDDVDQDIINNIIIKKTKAYAYIVDGEYVEADATYISQHPETDFYEILQRATEDAWGEYYTDPGRNANYGGIYRGSEEDGYDKTHGLTTWPTFWDFGIWTNNGSEFSRTGLPTPDGLNHDGLKNFILVAGYPVEPTHDTPVVPVEHMDKDVWYTMCFPFDLTDKQLEDCFGFGYELAQFTDVTIDEKGKYRLNFTTAIEADANGIMTHKHVPYMIHPNAHSFTLDDNGELVMTKTKFVLTDVIQTEEDYNMSPANMLTNAITATDPNGKVFTFVGYGHNYAMGETAQVVTPQYSFFLGTAAGETYPKYWRQTAANTRMTGSAWKKNTAIVLPPNSTLTYKDNRIIYDATGTALDYVSGEDSYSYINYVCPEYTVSAVGGSVKSMDIFFTNEPFIPNAINDIIEKETEKDSQIPAAYKNKIFNMSGQMVGTSPEGLEKGIYIMNGKKFIVR